MTHWHDQLNRLRFAVHVVITRIIRSNLIPTGSPRQPAGLWRWPACTFDQPVGLRERQFRFIQKAFLGVISWTSTTR